MQTKCYSNVGSWLSDVHGFIYSYSFKFSGTEFEADTQTQWLEMKASRLEELSLILLTPIFVR